MNLALQRCQMGTLPIRHEVVYGTLSSHLFCMSFEKQIVAKERMVRTKRETACLLRVVHIGHLVTLCLLYDLRYHVCRCRLHLLAWARASMQRGQDVYNLNSSTWWVYFDSPWKSAPINHRSGGSQDLIWSAVFACDRLGTPIRATQKWRMTCAPLPPNPLMAPDVMGPAGVVVFWLAFLSSRWCAFKVPLEISIDIDKQAKLYA